MKRIYFIIIIAFVLIVSSACQKDIPDPEARLTVIPMETTYGSEDITVSTYTKRFSVQHHVKGNDVFVECIVPSITFRNNSDSKKPEGKLVLYINGRKTEEFETAAFIVKGLSRGTHKLRIEAVQKNRKGDKFSKDFYVTIP